MLKRALIAGGLLGPLLVSVGDAGAGTGGFTFTPPVGWIDISRGAPEAQRAKAPPALRAQADNPTMTFMAIDAADWEDGFIENMNAVVETEKGTLTPNPTALALVVKGIEQEAAKGGFTYQSTKVEVVKVGGVPAGRLVGDLKGPGVVAKLVQYSISGDNAQAMLTYTTTPANFARYEPLFDASAQATLGAVAPKSSSSLWQSARIGAIAGAIGGGLGALLAARARRRKRLLQQQRQPQPPV